MKYTRMFCMLAVCFLASLASAEVYRYKDAAGNTRFTDNLADVPEAQRAGIQTEKEFQPPMPEEGGRQKEVQGSFSPDTPENSGFDENTGAAKTDPAQIDRLLKIKTALDEENAELIKASLLLTEEEENLSGQNAIIEHNEKVKAQNARVSDYERRRAAFQKESDAFSASLKQRLSHPPPSQQSPLPP